MTYIEEPWRFKVDNQAQAPLTYSVSEAARLLGISLGGAYELARRGELPGAIRLGGRIVVSREKLLAFVNGTS